MLEGNAKPHSVQRKSAAGTAGQVRRAAPHVIHGGPCR